MQTCSGEMKNSIPMVSLPFGAEEMSNASLAGILPCGCGGHLARVVVALSGWDIQLEVIQWSFAILLQYPSWKYLNSQTIVVILCANYETLQAVLLRVHHTNGVSTRWLPRQAIVIIGIFTYFAQGDRNWVSTLAATRHTAQIKTG